MKKRLLTLLGMAIALNLIAPAAGAQVSLPLFARQSVFNIEIEAPLRTLMRERSNTEYYEGKLRYRQADGTRHELDIQLRARGNYRRRRETCRFPPVRLNLKKKQVSGTEFEGQNILKLVTHCRPRSNLYEQLVLKEYLAYKIFERHSRHSFRTRLMNISWIDSEEKNGIDVRYGFVIEHHNELADRLGLSVADVPKSQYDRLRHAQASAVAMFQYLIGNTDFSIVAGAADERCCHNSVLLQDRNGKQVPVPYDFDFSGLVDAPYAGPNPRFKIESVTDRLYRGNCALNDEVGRTVSLFLENRGAVLQLIDEQEGLSNTSRRKARAFVEGFYEDISNPRRVENLFIKGCS